MVIKLDTLGARLRKARERKGWTQTYVCQKLGISNSTLSGYERNYREPDMGMIKAFADLYDVSVDWLLGRTNIPNPIPTIAFHRSDDPMADLPEEARKSVENFIKFIKKQYNIEDD